MSDTVHVTPRDDLVDHEESDDCICGPSTVFVIGGVVVTHRSLDGREGIDPSDRRLADTDGSDGLT